MYNSLNNLLKHGTIHLINLIILCFSDISQLIKIQKWSGPSITLLSLSPVLQCVNNYWPSDNCHFPTATTSINFAQLSICTQVDCPSYQTSPHLFLMLNMADLDFTLHVLISIFMRLWGVVVVTFVRSLSSLLVIRWIFLIEMCYWKHIKSWNG